MLNQMLQSKLVSQVSHELKNHLTYRSISEMLYTFGYKKLAEYFKKQADGELEHYTKFRNFLKENQVSNFPVEVSLTDMVPPVAASVGDLYVIVETNTTLTLTQIMQEAKLQGDEKTQAWLQWALEEQIEEEDEANRFRNLTQTNDWPMLELLQS